MISAKLVGITQPMNIEAQTAEELIAYAARVSNPSNQNNHKTAKRLLEYCIEHKHWSIFEMANAVVEVIAPRDITRQLLRHRSLSFQEFSQRYSDEIETTPRKYRRQDLSNRQNSVDDLDIETAYRADVLQRRVGRAAIDAYDELRRSGVAKECARVLLPEGLTMSRMYVNGTLRSWMHYLEVRDDSATQLEHMNLAQAIRSALEPAFPIILGVDIGDTINKTVRPFTTEERGRAEDRAEKNTG